jgi:hypothetical protein
VKKNTNLGVAEFILAEVKQKQKRGKTMSRTLNRFRAKG